MTVADGRRKFVAQLTRRRRNDGTASMSKDSEMSASSSASICALLAGDDLDRSGRGIGTFIPRMHDMTSGFKWW
jgi:hypothetical protein